MDEDILQQDKIMLCNVSAPPRPFSEGSEKKPKRSFHPKKTLAQRKAEREALKKRKARIIVRNLSFKSTEENLREHFSKFGTIVDLNLLKKSDGKLVGCAFVQFEKINQAAKAIHQLNGKELLDRTVSLDWAVNKEHYTKFERAKKQLQAAASKAAAKAAAPVKVDEEDDGEEDDNEDDDVSIKSEQHSDDEENDDGEDDEDDEDEDDEEDEKKFNIKEDPDAEEKETKPKKLSNDLVEGCTVFIKNIPFDASEADFKKCVLQFGAIYYALLSKDPVSGHSRGTGFVKFRAKESADMCLQAGTEFKLLDQVLDPVVAVTRMDIKKKLDDSKNKNPADSRNLYLTKEGMITAGSKAAENVSPGDMAKRLRLEQIKTQMLKDLNRFVSRERLTVHNIPPSYDSDKLRRVVEQHTKLKPTECRVMRENHPSPGVPQGKSKGFGFLAFKGHYDALMCLRRLNNNPVVFGKGNRPIVSFSLEDKSVHNIKKKRLERSQEKNPTFQAKKERRLERRKEARAQRKLAKANAAAATTELNDTLPKEEGANSTSTAAATEEKPSAKNLRRKALKAKLKLKKQAKKASKEAAVAPEPEFAGVLAEPGTGSARPRWKLSQQSQIHQEDISKKKKELKKEKQKRELNAEKKEIDRTKQRVKSGNEVDSFSFMVDKYRKLIDSNSEGGKVKVARRSKWYTE